MGKNKNDSNQNNEQLYMVAKGASFVGNKKSYFEGDLIDKSAFGKPEYFEKMRNGKNPKIVAATAEAIAKAKAKTRAEDGEVAEKADDESDKNPVNEKRKQLEKIAIDSGLYVAGEELSAIKDEALEKILKDAGLLN